MSRKVWAALLYMLPAFGVPALLAVYIGPEGLLRSPWAALALFLSCEVTLAILRFKVGLGASVHARWSEALAARTSGLAEGLATGSERLASRTGGLAKRLATGLEALASRTGDLGKRLAAGSEGLSRLCERRDLRAQWLEHCNTVVRGLAAPECAFVELNLVPALAGRESAGLDLEVPETGQEGARTLWDYVRSRSLQGQSLAILGPPGCGKTALLQHATQALAADRRDRIKVGAPDRLPVLLSLRDCAAAVLSA